VAAPSLHARSGVRAAASLIFGEKIFLSDACTRKLRTVLRVDERYRVLLGGWLCDSFSLRGKWNILYISDFAMAVWQSAISPHRACGERGACFVVLIKIGFKRVICGLLKMMFAQRGQGKRVAGGVVGAVMLF
jgi:hypothetical protein